MRKPHWLCHFIIILLSSCKLNLKEYYNENKDSTSSFFSDNSKKLSVLKVLLEPPSQPSLSFCSGVPLATAPLGENNEPSPDEYHIVTKDPNSMNSHLNGFLCFNKTRSRAYLFSSGKTLKAVLTRSPHNENLQNFDYLNLEAHQSGLEAQHMKIHLTNYEHKPILGVSLDKSYFISKKSNGEWKTVAIIVIPMLAFYRDVFQWHQNPNSPDTEPSSSPIYRMIRNPLKNKWEIQNISNIYENNGHARDPLHTELPLELVYLLPGFFVLRDYAQTHSSLRFMEVMN